MTSRRSLSTWVTLAIAGAGLAFLAPHPSAAADAMEEVATAAEHAGYAAGSDQLDAVHTHLHHVVNCLVGPEGEGFDSDELNPCADLGNGAIPDTADAEKKQALEEALAEAMAGLEANELEAAQAHASETATMLDNAMM
jgi:hypothetical protein